VFALAAIVGFVILKWPTLSNTSRGTVNLPGVFSAIAVVWLAAHVF